jgi:hypothetical protein
MSIEDLEEIRQEHETWLAELEGLAVEAIASNNWDRFYAHLVEFQNENDLHGETGIAIGEDRPSDLGKYFLRFKDKAEASTKDLTRPGADLLPTTEQNERKEIFPLCHQRLTTSLTTLTELTEDMEGKRA